MTFRMRIAWIGTLALALLVGCGGGADTDSRLVQITLQARYEKRPVTTAGLGAPAAKPARYAYAQIRNANTDALMADVQLDQNGVGTFQVPQGAHVYAVMLADVVVPKSGSTFRLHGNVKKGLLQSFASGQAVEAVPTWYTTSDSWVASNSITLTLTSKDSTSESGAFAIADQMVEFALGMGTLEPNLILPSLHVFWTSGTKLTSPHALMAQSSGGASLSSCLLNPISGRPMIANEIWYGGPGNGADAYNDSLLMETFAQGLFVDGSYWQVTDPKATSTALYGALVRRDNDEAYVSPWVSSESTIAFANGYATFLGCALRNNPSMYTITASGTIDTAVAWSLDAHDFNPTEGGEFYASGIARSQWGIWKNVLGGSTSGLTTLWQATIPTLTNQLWEYNNAPLGCYPTYLGGLKRMVGGLTYATINTELAKENVGLGTDVTLSLYLDSPALWNVVAPSPVAINGTLTTSSNPYYYDRPQAKTYRVYFNDGSHTLTLSTSSPGLIVELFDGKGFRGAIYATNGTPSSHTFSLTSGHHAVRVRVDPLKTFNGSPANYSLTIN
ncbi:MAG: hypothetical protein LWX11_09035 [Firmicutes bacterium]|nr:hypothetical protein [Bacillota bacterium]